MDKVWGLFKITQDAAPSSRTPRADAQQHIRSVLAQNGVDPDRGDTVGHGVAAAIGAIQAFAGEKGARRVDTVFKDPNLSQYYALPSNHPNAPAAHAYIAQKELEYWQGEHAKNPSEGTAAALQFTRDERVSLQRGFAQLDSYGRMFNRQYQQEFNPSGGHAQTTGPNAYYAQQSAYASQSATSQAGVQYPGQNARQAPKKGNSH
ncbi:hypothetical protein [Streptomyces sediminimaris]|uniref:hypothetical protein n=1 Tax=Streptomyces sediminimaris TaxID=3383721 RepID=UPI00399AEB44